MPTTTVFFRAYTNYRELPDYKDMIDNTNCTVFEDYLSYCFPDSSYIQEDFRETPGGGELPVIERARRHLCHVCGDYGYISVLPVNTTTNIIPTFDMCGGCIEKIRVNVYIDQYYETMVNKRVMVAEIIANNTVGIDIDIDTY